MTLDQVNLGYTELQRLHAESELAVKTAERLCLELQNEVDELHRFKNFSCTDILGDALTLTVDPPNENGPDSTMYGQKYHIETADPKYLTFTKNTWIKLLNRIHPLMRAAMYPALPEVADCDNWALLACAFISVAIRKSGKYKQGAFSKASANPWPGSSVGHAFNTFMDLNKQIWVYEPFNNKVIGLIEDTVDKYKVVELKYLA